MWLVSLFGGMCILFTFYTIAAVLGAIWMPNPMFWVAVGIGASMTVMHFVGLVVSIAYEIGERNK